MSRATRRRSWPAAALACVLLSLAATTPAAAPAEMPVPAEMLPLSSDLRVAARQGREVELHVRATVSDDYRSIAIRVTGDGSLAARIRDWNGKPHTSSDSWVAVPLSILNDSYRSLALRSLFPDDHMAGDDWIHIARSGSLSTYDEGMWQVAEWFGRGGADFPALMQANGMSSPELRAGQVVRVPAAMLHPAFKQSPLSANGLLYFAEDEHGPYAGYRLKTGEAIYSAIVVRFTGRTGADDVRELAETISRRSEIPDMRDIPVGFEIKIPYEVLEPEHLPTGHPRRLEAEAQLAEVQRELARQPVAGTRGGLRGVVIILDPGHGGRDLGTMNNGIWEHDYVYDVTCRLKKMLEEHTASKVWLTLEDRETGCLPSRGDKLAANRQGTILTDPTFLAREEGEAKIGVNLRWYLANSIYRKELKAGTPADRIVFLSLHADSRHPGLQGLMVYVPGAAYRTRTYGSTSATYRKYREVQEKPTVKFSKKDRVRSEAVSRKLADAVVKSFRKEALPIQPYQPVRDKVIRGKQKWVPAVLRGNAIPAKVLVEMVNLSNPKDAALLGSAKERERMAKALLGSLYLYFGEKPADLSVTMAAQ